MIRVEITMQSYGLNSLIQQFQQIHTLKSLEKVEHNSIAIPQYFPV